jgi:hypothetical protein
LLPFAASCPSGEVRWTTLETIVDAPANDSGAAAARIGVADHPEIVLFDSASSTSAQGAGSRDIGALLGDLSGHPALTLALTTTTTPDGTMAATAKAVLTYACGSPASR